MSGVLHPKLGSIHSIAKLEVDDEPADTAIRPPRPAYANDGPETTDLAVDADDEGDDKPEAITWVRSRHPRVQH